MSVLGLDRDGQLKISEAQVVSAVLLLVRLYEYDPIRVEANAVTRGVNPHALHDKGTSDWFMSHPRRPGFWAELKRRRSGTKASRRADQRAFAEAKRALGFKVYVAEENDPDPIKSFTKWFMALEAPCRANGKK